MQKVILYILFLLALLVLGAGILFLQNSKMPRNPSEVVVNSFSTCVEAGFPVMESNPRQCLDANGNHFTENIPEVVAKDDIVLESPLAGATISNPVKLSGKARGTWYFEASFPIDVVDWDGRIIGQGVAQANGDWMTEDFVPFTASIKFENATSTYSKKATLVLKKDNPSGDRERDASLEVPVVLP
jgi:hypothetical protein